MGLNGVSWAGFEGWDVPWERPEWGSWDEEELVEE